MVRWTRRQREVVLDKLPDLANLIAGALLFGQFLSGQPFSLSSALAGIVLWTVLSVWTVWLAGGEE